MMLEKAYIIVRYMFLFCCFQRFLTVSTTQHGNVQAHDGQDVDLRHQETFSCKHQSRMPLWYRRPLDIDDD
jgi:hypothetical protein